MKTFNVYPLLPIEPIKAKGSWLWDKNNQKYLDLYGGHGVISIGHNHDNWKKEIHSQLEKISFYSNSVENQLQEELAGKLTSTSGYLNHSSFFCNSGTEANEHAIKLACFHTGKEKILAFKNSFHGRSSGSVSCTDNSTIQSKFDQNNRVDFIELNNYDQLHLAFKKNQYAAVIIEGIQGVGGLDEGSEEYWSYLKSKCLRSNTLLICDEVQSGFGRTGKFFAHQHAKIEADIITMAKGMGNGFPIGGLLISPNIKAKFGLLGSTFGGNHLACSASISTINTIVEEGLMNNAKAKERQIKTLIHQLNLPIAIQGKGLMLGFNFDFDIKELRESLAMKYHVLTGASKKKNQLRILPSLAISENEIKHFFEQLSSCLSSIKTSQYETVY